jgi:hypothetical protein
MNKEQYFAKSRELNLHARCPILGRCKRRAWTIYYFSEFSNNKPKGLEPIEYLVNTGEFTEVILHNPVELSGESPVVIKGNSNWFCSGACPEVNLFDGSHAIMNGVSATSVSYDKYFPKEKWIVEEVGHYSECAEYSSFIFNLQFQNNDNTAIPKTSTNSENPTQVKKDTIKKLIAKSEIERTFEELDRQLHKNCTKRDHLLLLEGKHSKWKRDQNEGIADSSNVEIDRIRKALLDFCNELEATDWSVK